MKDKEDFENRIWQQYLGFINTPNLLLNNFLVTYPNFELTPSNTHNSALTETALTELQKQAYLGKRAEIFFKQWLEFKTEANLLAFSLQIFEDRITKGEFDFLWKNGNQYLHTELVYKQYIYIDGFGEDELSSWVGPNQKDFLHLKLKKLEQHQFPLLFEASTKALLKEIFGLQVDDFQQNLCFKAQLFLHFKEEQKHFKGINPKAIIGIWYHFQEFIDQLFEAFQFAIIPKQDWPVTPQNADWIPWITFQDSIPIVAASIQEKRSVKLWIKTPEQINQLFVIWEDNET